jgi:disulfide bond formation protein DsbB
MLGKLQEETNQITEGISPETLRYLTRLEQDLYNAVETRANIDSWLVFGSAQAASLTLPYVLFNLGVTLSIIQLFGVLTGVAPGIIGISQDWRFRKGTDGWEIDLGKNPVAVCAKIGVGGLISWNGTGRISSATEKTRVALEEAKKAITPNSSFLTTTDWLLLGAVCLAAIAGALFFRKDE